MRTPEPKVSTADATVPPPDERGLRGPAPESPRTATASDGLEIERVDSVDRLAAMAPDWEAMQRRCPEKHVLLDLRWVTTWLKIFGEGKKPCVLVLRSGATVVGIVPLILSRGHELFPSRKYHVHTADEYRYTRIPRFLRLLPIRRLTFPLSGALANRRGHFLFVEDDPRLYELTLHYVESMASEWDLLVLEGLPAGSRQEQLLLDAIARSRLRGDGRRFLRESLFTALPESMDLYLGARKRHFRKRFNADCRQALERHPDLQVREYRGARIDRGMETLLELEKRSWKVSDSRTRKFYIGPDPQLLAFHREAARAFAATDQACVVTMELGDRPVAGIHCLERDGVVSAIITFRDEEFSDSLTASPMFRRLLEASMERGMKELDFNGKTANIEKWANDTRLCTRYFFYNRRPYSRFLRALSTTAHRSHRALSALRDQGSQADAGA